MSELLKSVNEEINIKIRTPSRIHISLIDLNGLLGRVDGGVGFALENPSVEIEASLNNLNESNQEIVFDNEINNEYKEKFLEIFEKLKVKFDIAKIPSVNVISGYKPHCGLGSGTQISLALACVFQLLSMTCIDKINRISMFNKIINIRELAKIAGRGGTSGIGVAIFEKGGFILDAGHSLKVKKDFLPSSASKAPPPKILARYNFPWKVAVVIPEISGSFGRSEINLFKEYCPIPIEEVRKVTHTVLMGLLPSIVEEDLDGFMKHVSSLQKMGFKKVEVDRYPFMREIVEKFRVGMSSTGTALYTAVDTSNEGKKVAKELVSFLKERGIKSNWFVTNPNNSGAKIDITTDL